MNLEKSVAAKLAASEGHEDAVLLWRELWRAYVEGGAAQAEQVLADLLDVPGGDEGRDAEEGA